MSIVFRIATAADDRDGPAATINARQLAAFRSLLRTEGSRLGLALIDPDDDEETPVAYSFEARVCPLALASMARVFDFAADVIAVLDEAQFRSRCISFYRSRPYGPVAMRPSITSDLGGEMDLASGNAYVLLESLGLRPDSVGELPVAEVDDGHSGEEVIAAATDPGAERVHGFFANTRLFEVLMDALGWRRDPAR